MLREIQGVQGTCENTSEHKFKMFWLNNNRKFISNVFFLKKHGIKKQTPTPYRP